MFRRPAVVGLAVLLLSGCTLLTNPTGTITLPRQDFINTWARARQLYLVIRTRVVAACERGEMLPADCQTYRLVDQDAKALDFEIQAKISVPETELDWAMIEKILSFAVKLAL